MSTFISSNFPSNTYNYEIDTEDSLHEYYSHLTDFFRNCFKDVNITKQREIYNKTLL